jgi:hypothetical protein
MFCKAFSGVSPSFRPFKTLFSSNFFFLNCTLYFFNVWSLKKVDPDLKHWLIINLTFYRCTGPDPSFLKYSQKTRLGVRWLQKWIFSALKNSDPSIRLLVLACKL